MWLLIVGGLSLLVQRSMARGFAAADATLVMSFGFVRLPMAGISGFAFFGEVPEIWVWIGDAVIFASSIFITRRENVAERGAGGTPGATH